MAYFQVITHLCLEGLQKKNVSQDTSCPSRGSNGTSPELKAKALFFEPICPTQTHLLSVLSRGRRMYPVDWPSLAYN